MVQQRECADREGHLVCGDRASGQVDVELSDLAELARASKPMPAFACVASPTFASDERVGRKVIALFDHAASRGLVDVRALSRRFFKSELLDLENEIWTAPGLMQAHKTRASQVI